VIGFHRGEYVPDVTAVSGIDYADTIFTGMSATVVSPDRDVWNIFDLITDKHPEDDRDLWLAEAEALGRGHLVRMVDSCLRLGIYPDPNELGLNIDPEDGTFWAKVVGRLKALTALAMQKNRDAILAGDFDRLYLRIRLEGARTYIGPPKPSETRPAHVSIICEPLGAYATETCAVALADHVTSGTLTDRVKAATNYPGYLAAKERAIHAAGHMGVVVHDVITLKSIGPNGLVGPGECATSTLGGLWEVDGVPTVVVPDPTVHNVLPGRTAWWVMELAKGLLKLEARYGIITLTDLFTAKELWRTGNATYLSSIRRIGRLELPSIEVGRKLDRLLRRAMRGELYPEWSLKVVL
jgi:branched-subunit amino acid aminotransferase/4-amino-4-deoxychorismate lyase